MAPLNFLRERLQERREGGSTDALSTSLFPPGLSEIRIALCVVLAVIYETDTVINATNYGYKPRTKMLLDRRSLIELGTWCY